MTRTTDWQSKLDVIISDLGNQHRAADGVFYYCDEQISPFLPKSIIDKALFYCVHKTNSNSTPHEAEKKSESKGLAQVEEVWNYLYNNKATRYSLLVCIGGGVVSDIGGFAASTYKRGIRYITVPTTLLSMVDAAIGGKTGFNYMGVKNLIGSFYPPLDTIIDIRWLHSLPYEEVLSGYAEMIKHGLLSDDQYLYQLLSTECTTDIENKILQSITIKRKIVDSDPKERDLRKSLNFGHTIGHALEANSYISDKQTPLHHGYAVMQGMVAELYLSVVICDLDRSVLRTLSHYMLEHYGRPTCACQDYDNLLSLMRQDKKNDNKGNINFTLLHKIGTPIINEVVDEKLIREALDYLFSL